MRSCAAQKRIKITLEKKIQQCKCDFHALLRVARTHDFAKYFDIFKMKSKFLTKLTDWNGNAQADGNNDI